MVTTIGEDFWKCSECLHVMDGREETGGQVSISSRCFHIFHERCFRLECNTCPRCKLLVTDARLILNEEFPKRYREWVENPNVNILKEAFEREYPEAIPLGQDQFRVRLEKSHHVFEECVLGYQDMLKPQALRGLQKQDSLPVEELELFLKQYLKGPGSQIRRTPKEEKRLEELFAVISEGKEISERASKLSDDESFDSVTYQDLAEKRKALYNRCRRQVGGCNHTLPPIHGSNMSSPSDESNSYETLSYYESLIVFFREIFERIGDSFRTCLVALWPF